MKLDAKELARITSTVFDVTPGAPLFDNVPADMTWGELVQVVQVIADLLTPPEVARPLLTVEAVADALGKMDQKFADAEGDNYHAMATFLLSLLP